MRHISGGNSSDTTWLIKRSDAEVRLVLPLVDPFCLTRLTKTETAVGPRRCQPAGARQLKLPALACPLVLLQRRRRPARSRGRSPLALSAVSFRNPSLSQSTLMPFNLDLSHSHHPISEQDLCGRVGRMRVRNGMDPPESTSDR